MMVLSPMSNRASPSPATLKSSYASADVGLINGIAELVMEVRCDDCTHEDLLGMLTKPTHCERIRHQALIPIEGSDGD
jgi:hypothetical protein